MKKKNASLKETEKRKKVPTFFEKKKPKEKAEQNPTGVTLCRQKRKQKKKTLF